MATFFGRYSEAELRTAKSRAIDEAVDLGRSGLRRKYGFGSAKKFVAVTAGHHFDSKALSAAVAAHLTPPLALTSDSSSGGVATTRILDGCDIPWIDTDHLKNRDRSRQSSLDAAGADSSAHITRNYWWASQGENYSTVIEQGSLWAPHFRVDGQPGHEDWQALHRMMPGDVVFHYAAQQFKAISLVVAAGVESDRPPGYDGYPHGTLVLVQPFIVDMEVRLDVLKTVFPPGVGPMNRTGNPGRVYVAAIPPDVGEPLANYLSAGSLRRQSLAEVGSPTGELDTGRQLDIETTDIAGSMFRRAEQRYLREALLAHYGNQCAICGRFLPKNLLIAAHIKLRSQSSNRDRLNFAAAAMLACSLGCDALFERGYLTVDGAGLVRTTPTNNPELLSVLDKVEGSRCLAFSEATRENFEFHRRSHDKGI